LATSSLRFFEHVQSLSTSFRTMKTTLRPDRFLLLSCNDLQVLTAFSKIFQDVVGRSEDVA
jgi:hypothetical protein